MSLLVTPQNMKSECLTSRAIQDITTKMTRMPIQTNGHAKKTSPIDLSKTENFLIRDELLDICKNAISEDLLAQHFSSPENEAGDPALLESLANLFNNYFNPCIPVKTSHISTAPGAAGCLDALISNLCEPGDGVLIPGPHWNEFDLEFQARSSIQPIVVNIASFSETYTTNLTSALSDAMDRASCPIKALILTNLHSPFGQCYSQAMLEKCLRFCQQKRIHFISDEVYALTSFSSAEVYSFTPFISALSLNARALGCDLSRIHTIWSISKDFGASGFRVGCTVSQNNKELVKGLSLAPNSRISSLSTIFATSLLSAPTLPFLIALNSARLAESYMMITDFFVRHNIKYVPVNAGLSVFARIAPKAKTSDEEIAMVARLKENGVLVSPGESFTKMPKEKGWARLSFSLEVDQLQEALRRIESVMGIL